LTHLGNNDPIKYVKDQGLAQVNDTDATLKIIDDVFAENPKAVEDIKRGKIQTLGFLVGQVMQKSQGKANPAQVTLRLKEIFGLS
jgi:aspartyl-tRNA(Asn)/glutamyl-tRNA(Gln) amidotransferase subunit B